MDGVTQPRQQRSRESFARVRSATLALLAEKGPAGVTIADVSERANVSVGTIYGRVGNRANLLRVVQEEELARIVQSMGERLEDLTSRGENSVTDVIRTYVHEMQRSSQSIRVLVAAATEVGELSEAGPASWRVVRELVVAALRGANDAPQRSVTEPTMEWVFEMIEACTIRHLESAPTPKSDDETIQLIAHLSHTVELLLADATSSSEACQTIPG